jgi:hypothetical protein
LCADYVLRTICVFHLFRTSTRYSIRRACTLGFLRAQDVNRLKVKLLFVKYLNYKRKYEIIKHVHQTITKNEGFFSKMATG